MQTFRTSILLQESKNKLKFDKGVCFIGSCFAEHISEKLFQSKFQVLTNPFGIIFNPISIADVINRVMINKLMNEDEIFYSNEMYKSFLVHSKLSRKGKEEFLKDINEKIYKANHFLSDCSHLFITFGTSQVFKHKKNNIIVANNHKIPLHEFEKRMLSVNDIIEIWSPLIAQIKILYPRIQIIFSVSPVRHLKMGFEENMLSKSILLQSIHKLIEGDQTLLYFPAFEIMIDDLRDYRFYESDMIHPNSTSIQYIFGLFKNAYLDMNSQEIVKEIEKIYVATLHRPFDLNSNAHVLFKKEMLKKINLLQERNRNLHFESEINFFSS